jgi:hypothetical protein
MTTETVEPVGVQLTILEEMIPYYDQDDGKDHFTHIINPPNNIHIWEPGMEAQDIVAIARATGQIVVALCGYKFVPKRNPEKYPACDSCIKIAHDIMAGE